VVANSKNEQLVWMAEQQVIFLSNAEEKAGTETAPDGEPTPTEVADADSEATSEVTSTP
jgi:hypothetical protein